MIERDEVVQRLRESVAPGKPLDECASAAEDFLRFYRRSRAITQRDLVAVDVQIVEDDGEV